MALQRGTGTLCSLRGDLVTRESQYSATLVNMMMMMMMMDDDDDDDDDGDGDDDNNGRRHSGDHTRLLRPLDRDQTNRPSKISHDFDYGEDFYENHSFLLVHCRNMGMPHQVINEDLLHTNIFLITE